MDSDPHKGYCLDTSVFIESWSRHYRPNVWGAFWRKLADQIEAGTIISPQLVKVEIERKHDELYEWIKQNPKLIVDLDEEQQRAHETIINRYPRLIDSGKHRSMADPWVIALAKLRNYAVVTYEGPGSLQRPKIPDVCKNLGVACISVSDMLDNLNEQIPYGVMF